jgi:hypothetical protein
MFYFLHKATVFRVVKHEAMQIPELLHVFSTIDDCEG